jgi:hypothetical protein
MSIIDFSAQEMASLTFRSSLQECAPCSTCQIQQGLSNALRETSHGQDAELVRCTCADSDVILALDFYFPDF